MEARHGNATGDVSCGEPKRIVMLPFLARGHLIHFVALAELLAARTPFAITLVSTPKNAQMMRSILDTATAAAITVVELPFCSTDHGLPDGVESSDAVPPALTLHVFHASESLQPAFERLISEGPSPVCVIGDIFTGWTIGVAEKLGVKHVTFLKSSAFGDLAAGTMWHHLPHRKTDSNEFELPGLPGLKLQRSQLTAALKAADGTDPFSAFVRKNVLTSLRSKIMICDTVEELEPKGIQQLRDASVGSVVFAMGPIMRRPSLAHWGRGFGITPERCSEWLDLHEPRAVLFVCFSAHNKVSAWQMKELALGLEASGHVFIWAVTPSRENAGAVEFSSESLPEGFEARVSGRKQGLVVRGWVPQHTILSHPATGAFLNHCGWHSVLESLRQGVPIIGWPMGADQFYISKELEEELGVGLELTRGQEAGVGREVVARVVGEVMGGKKGEELRKRAATASEALRRAAEDGGSSLRAVEEFAKTLVEGMAC
ncbi:hypothetical protein AMTRI_Chr05g65720 [Amborella trichopoda]